MSIKRGFSDFSQLQTAIAAMKAPIFFSPRTGTAPGNTRYIQLNQYGNINTSDSTDPANASQSFATIFGMTGTLKNLYCWLDSDPGVAGTFTLTIIKNAVPTAITINVPSGILNAPILVSDLLHNVAVGPTDLFVLEAANNALSDQAISGAFVIEFDPS